MFGGSDEPKPAAVVTPVVKNDPESRAVQVAWTAARAQHCGFHFSPPKLKSSLMAYESGQGTQPEELIRLDKVYDLSQRSVAVRLKNFPDYCNPAVVQDVRDDLKRHLASDFTPRPRKPRKNGVDESLIRVTGYKSNASKVVQPR